MVSRLTNFLTTKNRKKNNQGIFTQTGGKQRNLLSKESKMGKWNNASIERKPFRNISANVFQNNEKRVGPSFVRAGAQKLRNICRLQPKVLAIYKSKG
jgi:hypothetical protein